MLKNNTLVEILFYSEEYNQAVFSFELPEEQHQFTALPKEALMQCSKDQSRHPIVILADGVPVGFFVLHQGEGISPFSNNPNAVLVRALSINSIYQGKGFAKKAMANLPEFVSENFPSTNEIVLAVNVNNITAKEMYLKVGFVDKGIRREGRIGMQYILHYDLN